MMHREAGSGSHGASCADDELQEASLALVGEHVDLFVFALGHVGPLRKVFLLGEYPTVLAVDARGHCIADIVAPDGEHLDGLALYTGWERI